METSQLEERARGKLERKNLDPIAANNLKVAGAGFGTDTNVITLIDKQQTRHTEQMSKGSGSDGDIDGFTRYDEIDFD